MHSAGEEDFGQSETTTTPTLSPEDQHKGRQILFRVFCFAHIAVLFYRNLASQALKQQVVGLICRVGSVNIFLIPTGTKMVSALLKLGASVKYWVCRQSLTTLTPTQSLSIYTRTPI